MIKLISTGKGKQISSNQIELNQIGSNWIKRDQIGSSRIKSDETGLNQFLLIFRYQIGQKKKNWIKLVSNTVFPHIVSTETILF